MGETGEGANGHRSPRISMIILGAFGEYYDRAFPIFRLRHLIAIFCD